MVDEDNNYEITRSELDNFIGGGLLNDEGEPSEWKIRDDTKYFKYKDIV